MACFHPKICHALKLSNGKYVIQEFNRESYQYYMSFPGNREKEEILMIPCGRCIGCRERYSREWALRCMLEAKQWTHNYFLTLTYNDDNVPFADSDFGLNMTLDKRDVQLFLKRLREYFSRVFGIDNIRFFCCGEYGPKNMRPHYHMILFNCPIPDLKFVSNTPIGDALYTSSCIDKLWDKGFITIGECNYLTCSYTARYVLKKQFGDNLEYCESRNIQPEFMTCSRRPGIAHDYFDENFASVYDLDSIVIPTKDGSKSMPPPKYFDHLYENLYPDLFSAKKALRQSAFRESSSLDLNEYLGKQELIKSKKLALLHRDL